MESENLIGAETPHERADAARNRARVLEAAAELFAARGAENVTMDHIARAAGIGRATLYRRYPDRSAIALALLDEHERAVQAELLGGAAPLGPGALPAERLAAFYDAMIELLRKHLPLALGTEVGRSRFETGAYGFWRTHVRALAAEAGAEDPDALADLLLAPIAPEVFRHQREDRRLSLTRIRAALRALAFGTLGGRANPDD